MTKLAREERLAAFEDVLETVEETAHEFLAVAWESQEQAMDETGEIDPKTLC